VPLKQSQRCSRPPCSSQHTGGPMNVSTSCVLVRRASGPGASQLRWRWPEGVAALLLRIEQLALATCQASAGGRDGVPTPTEVEAVLASRPSTTANNRCSTRERPPWDVVRGRPLGHLHGQMLLRR